MSSDDIPATDLSLTEVSLETDDAKLVNPVQMFQGGYNGFQDFAPHPMKIDSLTSTPEVKPVPKDEYAPESVTSEESLDPSTPPVSAETVHELPLTTMDSVEDAAKENGTNNEKNEDEPTTETTTTLVPETSSPSSSSEEKTGSRLPPAPVKPPTKD